MPTIITIENLSKTYASGFQALKHINLDILRGEIFALLGPNGAGKTTLISTICGIVRPSEGRIRVDGHDIVAGYRATRSLIGLVPQELTTDAFESVWATVSFSRGLFGKPPNPGHVEKVLRELSLWDKKDSHVRTLSGGMKRRLMIAKALSHEPRILFLDEPTAGMNPQETREAEDLIFRIRDLGLAVLVIEHDMRFIFSLCDRVLCLVRGETLVEGTPEEVQSDPRVIEAYIGTGTDDKDEQDTGDGQEGAAGAEDEQDTP